MGTSDFALVKSKLIIQIEFDERSVSIKDWLRTAELSLGLMFN